VKFLCLCAIYNHRQELTESLLQMWLDQTHKDSVLVFIDDRPPEMSLERHGGIVGGLENVHIFYNSRYPNLMAKYTAGIEFAAAKGIEWDAVCVMDDDDSYLPRYLEIHNSWLLHTKGLSYPSHVFSTYGQALRTEEAGGRFWASAAYRRDLFEKIGGFGDSARADFDQDMLKRAFAHSNGEWSLIPQYVYHWELSASGHVSGLMKGIADTSWYQASGVARATGPLVPHYDESHLWTRQAVYAAHPQDYPELAT
jgi:glycosyltransferase involved in cell wall biosynthesis